MNTTNGVQAAEQPANIIPLTTRRTSPKAGQRFKILEFTNPRTGTPSWRVSGIKRSGDRVRENFAEEPGARCRQIELETEYLQGHVETAIQATKLTADQVRLSEAAMVQLGDDWQRILDAVTYWQQHGKKTMAIESPRIDDAVVHYQTWLKASTFRDATKRHWKNRMNVFKNSVPNIRVADVTPDFIEDFLKRRDTTPGGKDTDRRAVSRFFSWCIERPRKWATTNPCRDVKVERAEAGPVKVLTVDECKKLLAASEAAELAPYTAVCLFGGLRPFEAARLTWDAVNLKDREIRLEGWQTKTGSPRVVSICDTLLVWLKAHKGVSFFGKNWRKRFDAAKLAAGFGTPDEKPADDKEPKLKQWPNDVMRHTAISHYFRKTGSYGQTAEQFGNSEAIIKKHYQGRVSSEDTNKFYALRPTKKKK